MALSFPTPLLLKRWVGKVFSLSPPKNGTICYVQIGLLVPSLLIVFGVIRMKSWSFPMPVLGVLSTLSQFSKSDHHERQIVEEYLVNTISLQDLLDERNAPRFVEFLSIDTEGSELEILSALNWEDRSFGFIAVEHNYTDNRENIFNLLSSKGYLRVLEEYSKWDDWYIHESLKLGG
jgi:hypothetical protein